MEEKYQKGNALHVLKVLERHSDENHPLTQEKIKEFLQTDFNVSLERKAIGNVIDSLEEMDYDIVKGDGKPGIYLGSRVFEPSEITYLVDSIYSSKMISKRGADNMVDHLTDTLSEYEKEDFSSNSIKYSGAICKPNKNFFLNIDIINDAIKQNKKVKYTSISYDNDGKLVDRYGGYALTITPYYTINSQGNYYLICSRKRRGAEAPELSVMRMDRINTVELLKHEEADKKEMVKGLGNAFDIADYIAKHIYLFGGDTVNATMLIHDDNRETPAKYNPKSNGISYIKEWFGENAKIYTKDGATYADIIVNENALLYWAMQYSRSVTVIKPEATKEKIKEMLLKTLKDYE